MAAGQPVARALCVLLSVFWTVRLFAAAFLFDVRPYLTNGLYRAGYHATNVVFVYLVAIYSWTAWTGGNADCQSAVSPTASLRYEGGAL
jgi:hypothetical protein